MLKTIVDYQNMPFEHAVVENVTLIMGREHPAHDYYVSVLRGMSSEIKLERKILASEFMKNRTYAFAINSNSFIDSLFNGSIPLSSICNVNQAIALKGDKSLSCKTEYQPGYYKLLDGRNISKYGIHWTGVFLDYDLDRIHSCKRKDIFERPEKLLFRRVSATLMFTYDNSQYYALNTLVVLTEKDNCPCGLKYLLGLLNSKLMNYIYANKYKSTKTVFSEIQARSVGELPIKYSNDSERLVSLVEASINARQEDYLADIDTLQNQIDQIVYRIYGLSDDEKAIVEQSTL